MKFQFALVAAFFLIAQYSLAQMSIKEARIQETGTVEVQGIVTAKFSEVLCYIQDESGGIAIYDDKTSELKPGFEVKVKGLLDNFNNLLEIKDVSVEVIEENAEIPAPITIENLDDGFKESYEGMLLQFEGVTFTKNGSFIAGGSNVYPITDRQSEKQVYIQNGVDIDGTPIPGSNDAVTLIGIMGQYNDMHQLQPRSLEDIIFVSGKPIISSALIQKNTSQTGFEVCFTTQNLGTTRIKYTGDDGTTGEANNTELTTDHCIMLEGLNPAIIYEVTAESAGSEGEISTSTVYYMVTESASTGEIDLYFNNPVDVTVATEEEAEYSENGFAQIIIDLINKAESTVDIAVYNLDDKNDIISAINNVHEKGITVRMIINSGVEDFRAASINIGDNLKISPASQSAEDGIMHNKFIIVDAQHEDPNNSYVLTGSTNWTDNQLNIDPNNIIIVQDQSLAKVYTKEFEEMYIDGLFGSKKTANTPSQLKIGGKDVSVHFSPSDNVENTIKETIATTDYNLYIALLSFTRWGISYDVLDLVEEKQINAYAIIDAADNEAAERAYNILNDASPEEAVVLNQQNNIFHHKYLIVDPNHNNSDPTVLTGSHNWSNSAQSRNDENTLIIHDANIANQYYQEFLARLFENEGMLTAIAPLNLVSKEVAVYPNPVDASTTLQFQLDKVQAYQVDIVDINGKIFEQISGNAVAGANQIQLKTKALAKGMYFVQLHFNNQLDAIMPLVIAE